MNFALGLTIWAIGFLGVACAIILPIIVLGDKIFKPFKSFAFWVVDIAERETLIFFAVTLFVSTFLIKFGWWLGH